jgi:glycosyltransferase involved in cell wall biosynthesis
MGSIADLGALVVGHPNRPLLSVLMPTYNPQLHFLDAAIESLQAQWYGDWELCIADDASTAPGLRDHLLAWAKREPRIQLVIREQNGHISAASNSALALARGQWVVLMDQDDLIPTHALWCVVEAIAQHPDAGIIYSDEDKIDGQGQRFNPYFKPAFDLDLIRGQNMISHLGVYRRQLTLDVGGFRVGYEGSQDHDLALRCLERLRADQVIHIPRVLYHWRVHEDSTASGVEAKPYALDAGLRAVQGHLQRSCVHALVQPHTEIPHYVVLHRWERSIGDGAHPRTSLKWRLLCWSDSSSASAIGPPQLDARLKPLMDAIPFPFPTVAFEPSWLHASDLVKVWAAQVPADGRDMVLLVCDSVAEEANWTGDLEAWLAHPAEPGVGAVGPARRSQTGQLLDAGWLRRRNGSYAPLSCGLGRETHGYYGQLSLQHGVSALDGSVVALRLQAIDSEASGLRLKSGWRMAWTPVATAHATSGAWVVGGISSDNHGASLVISSAADDAESKRSVDDCDPSYSPHLCEHHLDHRLATAEPCRLTKARKR